MTKNSTRRLRLFAGPNGSGKTTLCRALAEQVNLYHVVSPDDILELLKQSPVLDLTHYSINPTTSDLSHFITKSTYDRNIKNSLKGAIISNNTLDLSQVNLSTYNVALISGFLRSRMMKHGVSFSFESVFSHPSKIDELKRAEKAGYKVYLYFVATDDVEINIDRVRQRVAEGGHGVPQKKIRSRYSASLDNLVPALKHAHRAYIFDNSFQGSRWLAELTPQNKLILKTEQIPLWFNEHVIQKIQH